MCNAHNHYVGCRCGFGGEGHLGGGGYRGGAGAVPAYYSYHSSMRDLAQDLGHSLLFPVFCRYCGQPIWLFADANGGFAIFDSRGWPWPKHECWGINPKTPRYSEEAPRFSSRYRFPIPADKEPETPEPGASIDGTLISAVDATNSSARVVDIYDGRHIWEVALRSPIPLGTSIHGRVEAGTPVPVLKDLEICELPPSSFTLSSQTKAELPTDLAALPNVEIWRIQEDASAIRKTNPETAQLLKAGLEALLNGHTLTGVAFLAEALTSSSDSLPTELKARHVRTVFRALSELQLQPLAPGLWNALSRGTRETIRGDSRDEIQKIVMLGRLRGRLEASATADSRLEARLRRERIYSSRVCDGKPVLRSAMSRLLELARLRRDE